MAEFDVIRAYSLKLPLAIAPPLEYNWRLSGRDFPYICITLRKVDSRFDAATSLFGICPEMARRSTQNV